MRRLATNDSAITSQAEVWQSTLDGATLLCVFNTDEKIAGAIVLKDAQGLPATLDSFLEKILAQSRDEMITLQAKVAGDKQLIDALKTHLQEYDVTIVGSRVREKTPLETVFYTDSGRLRVAEMKLTTEPPPPLVISESKAKEGPFRVLIVDDSVTIRKVLASVLSKQAGFEVVAAVENPIEADKVLQKEKIDVITLDINMPVMDGITYLQQLQHKPHPPVVMISAINVDDANKALHCFDLGAIGYIEKPSNLKDEEQAEKIRSMVKTAAMGNTRTLSNTQSLGGTLSYTPQDGKKDLILIGASTGGTQAITAVLQNFPENSPPVLIVQHIPPVFSAAFAHRLDHSTRLSVKEAADGDEVLPGHAYVAPGGKQMRVQESGGRMRIEITDDPPVCRQRPAVEYLYQDIAKSKWLKRYRVSACILTGMGNDGAKGLKALRDSGVFTIAEAEETCVVFGMPKEAIKAGGAEEIAPLHEVARKLFKPFR